MHSSIVHAGLVLMILQLSSQLPAEESELEQADAVVRNYLTQVASIIGKDPRSFPSQEAVLKKFHELGETHLLKHKALLHKKAGAEYLKLTVWKVPKTTQLTSIRGEMSRLEDLEMMFPKGGYEVPPYDHHTFATLWWDSVYAAKTIRELAFRLNLSRDEVAKRKFMEQYAVPRVYRQSKDPDKPVIAYFDGKELFVVHLVYTEVGIYALAKIEWFKVTRKE